MKFSKYNYFLRYKNNHIGINMITELMFCVNENNFQKIIGCDNLLKMEKEDPILFSLCKKLGLVIASDIDEDLLIKAKYRLNIFNDRSYRLTLNPTLDCNLKCWYCYETHTPIAMDDNVSQNIIKYVTTLIEKNKISTFHLDWFGGEPLLLFDEIVYPISKKIQTLCKDNNVRFLNSITTNGSLITPEMINQFNDIELFTFQITLDGTQKNHDSVRKTIKGEGTYNKIVSNVIALCNQLNFTDLCLRINYQNSYLNNVLEIINSFPREIRPKIDIFFQQIWQMEGKEDTLDLTNIKKAFQEEGFKKKETNQYFKGYRCYADKYNQAIINPDGSVFKCTARDFIKESPDGRLLDDGTINWDLQKIAKRFGQSPFEAQMCDNCSFLPLCLGPCSQKMVDLGLKNLSNKHCLEEGIKQALNERLIDYYHTYVELSQK